MKTLLLLMPLSLYAMDDQPAVIETHHSTYDVRIIPITADEEAEFQRSVIAALDREANHRLAEIEPQVPQDRSIRRTLRDNKKIIISNLITALLSSAVTLVVHFTAQK